MIKGLIPELGQKNYKSSLTITLNNKRAVKRNLTPGKFNIMIELPRVGEEQNISLQFSNLFPIPAESKKLAAAKLTFVGFQ